MRGTITIALLERAWDLVLFQPPDMRPFPRGLLRLIDVSAVEKGLLPLRKVLVSVPDATLLQRYFEDASRALMAKSRTDDRIATCAEAAASIAAQLYRHGTRAAARPLFDP